jgi:diguanylate cyclase (GGDEF)-like protein/PAS domain S-box-containing protein
MNIHQWIYWLSQHTLRTKVTAAAGLFVLIAAVISALNVASVPEMLKKEKAIAIRQSVEMAHTLVSYYYDEYRSHRMSEDAAKRAAAESLSRIRYDGANYVWINDLTLPVPRMVMHPIMPELAGQILTDPIYNCATSEQAGSEGVILKTDGKENLFVAFNNVVRKATRGYVTYSWPKYSVKEGFSIERFPKLSYVQLFEPWGWVVGSGIYIDDVEQTLLKQAWLNILAWSFLLLAGAAFVFIIHRALTPLTEAAAEIDSITQQHGVLHPIKVQHPDEVGLLVNSFNRLQAQLADESKALHENRELLLQAQRMAHVGHLTFELAQDQWTSSEVLDQILGITGDTIRDKATLLALCHPEDQRVLSECLSSGHAACQHSFDHEFRILRPDSGEQRWLHGRGRQDFQDTQKLFIVLQDITTRKQHEESLNLAASVFSNSQEGIIITDTSRCILDVNRAFTQITGYARAEVLGKNPRLLKSDNQQNTFYEAMWSDINTRGYWSGEIWNKHKNGKLFDALMNISAVQDTSGQVCNYVGIFSDITVMKQHQQKMEHLAHFDALTGLPNRALLADRLAQALATTRRSGKMLAVCYLDLDGFKPVNDQYGHKTGDALLIEMGRRMLTCTRAGDTVARIGGDEFVILLLGISEDSECQTAINRLLGHIAEPVHLEHRVVHVSASVGVTLFPNNDVDSDMLLRHADLAMYQAKQCGKNCYCIFDTQAQASES